MKLSERRRLVQVAARDRRDHASAVQFQGAGNARSSEKSPQHFNICAENLAPPFERNVPTER